MLGDVGAVLASARLGHRGRGSQHRPPGLHRTELDRLQQQLDEPLHRPVPLDQLGRHDSAASSSVSGTKDAITSTATVSFSRGTTRSISFHTSANQTRRSSVACGAFITISIAEATCHAADRRFGSVRSCSAGLAPPPPISGRTKTKVRDKLIRAAKELEAGVETPANYTVADAVEDWLSKGLKGRDAGTVTTNCVLADRHVISLIGKAKLKELRGDDVDEWLDGLRDRLSTRTQQGIHAILKRSIRQAQARDRVTRNVAELVTTPKGMAGRPSKALTLPQAM
ncbi:hypothetical protein ABZ914_13940 [Spirillospora sp. NPDC046719]